MPMVKREYSMTASGLIVPTVIVKKQKRPIAFDFFCGAGGMGLGIIQAGFEIVGANEFDPYAAITYMVNLGHYPMQIHYLDGDADKEKLDKAVVKSWGLKGKKDCNEGIDPEALKKAFGEEILPQKLHIAGSGWIKHTDHPGVRNFWFGDMHRLKGHNILDTLGLKQGDLDLVCGGPPCQGFSRAGKQIIGDPRNALIYEYARLIVELQPKTFVMEEVPDVVNFFDPDGVPVLDKFCLMLEDGGYGKWSMIKKSLLMQTGAAVAIKGTKEPRRVSGSAKRQRASAQAKNEETARPQDAEQMQLF